MRINIKTNKIFRIHQIFKLERFPLNQLNRSHSLVIKRERYCGNLFTTPLSNKEWYYFPSPKSKILIYLLSFEIKNAISLVFKRCPVPSYLGVLRK